MIRNIRHTNKLGMISQKDSDDSEEEFGIVILNKKEPEKQKEKVEEAFLVD